jgi:hypothetical protein
MAFIISSSSLMPTSGKKIGGSIFQICLLPGLIFASKEFLFLVTSFIPFFDRQILHNSRLSTPSLLSSVPLTSIKKKQGIQSLDTYRKITLGEYRALCEKGAPKAIPTMCILTIKKDENLFRLRAKSRIVVLGNHEDRLWSKSDRFAPVLHLDPLRFLTSLAVQKRRALQQGDCKNTFCQGILPPEEITIVRPPSGDPDADPQEYWLLLKTLYGLRRSPRHWYHKINMILISIGLTPSLEDPCLYSGFIQDPSDPTSEKSTSPLTLGLYVNNFVYFSEDPSVKLCSAVCWPSNAKLISWASSNGFLAFISCGGSLLPPLRSISISRASPPISSRASSKTPAM